MIDWLQPQILIYSYCSNVREDIDTLDIDLQPHQTMIL